MSKGIDVYFDNVGGSLLENVLYNMKIHGRVACCGAVSQYDTSGNYGQKISWYSCNKKT